MITNLEYKTLTAVLPQDPTLRREFKKTQAYQDMLQEKRTNQRVGYRLAETYKLIQKKEEALKQVLSKADCRVCDYQNQGRYFVFEDGRIYSYEAMIFKKHSINNSGYHYTSINKGDRKLIHRLVAECFLPAVEGKNEINHKDMDKSNNHVSNLEWTTRKENIKHSFTMGRVNTHFQGSKSHFAKITEEQVLEIRDFYSKGFTKTDLAKMYHLNKQHVDRLVKRLTWKHI